MLGHFDAVVSSLAIDHLEHERKRSLYREVFEVLRPGGMFANFEHVASTPPRLPPGHQGPLALTADIDARDDRGLRPTNAVTASHPGTPYLPSDTITGATGTRQKALCASRERSVAAAHLA